MWQCKMEILSMRTLLALLLPTMVYADCMGRSGDENTRMMAYDVKFTEGINKCGLICALEGRCEAINFHSETLKCELVEQGARVGNDSTGWSYISDLSFVSHLIGSCSGETLSEYSVCVKLTSGSHTVAIKYCPLPPPVAHATAPDNSRLVGASLTYTCETGYLPFGSGASTCGTDGQWKGLNFECKDCGDPPMVTSGTVLAGNKTIGSTRFYLCGNVLSPDANAYVTCQNNGQWTTPAFTCECPSPPSVTNASPSSNQKTVGTVLNFTCDTGYVAAGTPSITCQPSGSWTAVSYTCTDCGEPPAVISGTVLAGNKTVGSKRFYLCGSLSSPDANAYVTCQNNGQWTTAAFTCECPSPPSVANASPSSNQKTVGTVITFTCNTGFTAGGSPSITCQSSGSWTAPTYMCTGWPYGTYSLLQPTTGCPSGFLVGQKTFHTESTGSNSNSNSDLAGSASGGYVVWHFCTKTDANANTGPSVWPAGSYCIMQYGDTCPTGFSSGYMYFDEEDTDSTVRPKSGALPKMKVDSQDTELYFCCRSDGSKTSSMAMATDTPFVLFAYSGTSCQSVEGMTSNQGHTFFDNENNLNIDDTLGTYPEATGPPNWDIYYCYYVKI